MFFVSITGVLLIWRSPSLSLPALLLLLLHVRHDVISVPHKPTVPVTTKAIHVFRSARIHHLRQPQDQTQFPDIHKLSPVDDGVVFQIPHDAILLYGRVDGFMVELEPRFEKTSSGLKAQLVLVIIIISLIYVNPPSISKVHQSFLWPPKLIENSENLISFAFGCELLSQNCQELFVCGTTLHFVFFPLFATFQVIEIKVLSLHALV
ncbi:hypothetical protein COP2_044794 [Malus domestica]